MNFKQAKLAMKVLFAAGITPHFIGRHGIGKSAGVYQFAAENDYEVAEIRVGLMADAGDLVGIQEFLKCEQTGQAYATKHILPDWFMKAVSDVQNAAASGKGVIIFIDELNRGHKDLLQAIFELVYDKSLKGVKMRDNCHVVAASNPPTDDYAVLDFADSAFQDRFCHIKLEPSVDEFIQFGKTLGQMENSVVDFIAEYPQMLETEGAPFSLDFVSPSRRSWDRLSKILKVIDSNPEFKEVELELMFGIVGEKAALAYRTFRDSYIKSIKAQDVLDNYSKIAAVRDSVTNAINKGRTDMMGTLTEELTDIVKKLEGLTQDQADNLTDLVHDLPIEHAYALALKLTSSDVSKSIMKIDGVSPGLYGHEKFVSRIGYIKEQRMAIKAQAEEAKKKTKSKKKSTEEVPF
jgi:hypothetical protein